MMSYLSAKTSCTCSISRLKKPSLLVVNKVDLLTDLDRDEVTLVSPRSRYPEKTLLLQESLTPEGVSHWLEAIENASLGTAQ
jgi:Ni2+-binding GTPase involved in maturation of urease and hydrogenase